MVPRLCLFRYSLGTYIFHYVFHIGRRTVQCIVAIGATLTTTIRCVIGWIHTNSFPENSFRCTYRGAVLRIWDVYYINFELAKKTIWAILQRIIELSTQKIVIRLSKIWVWDQRSRIQESKRHRILYPGSGSATLQGSTKNEQWWQLYSISR